MSLSEPVDVAALLGRIAEIVRQLTRAGSVILWQVQWPGNLLVRRAWSTDPSLSAVSLPDRRAFGEGVAGWIAEHREPLFVTGDIANPTVLRFLTQARVPVLAKPFGAEAFYQAVDTLTARR